MSTTVPTSHLDLLENSQVVILGTNGPEGQPEITALWFVYADGQVHMSINDSRRKAKNLARDPRASAFFVDPQNPYRTLELRGTVTITPDPDYAFAAAVNRKYQADVAQMDKPGESRSWVTLNVEKVLTFGG